MLQVTYSALTVIANLPAHCFLRSTTCASTQSILLVSLWQYWGPNRNINSRTTAHMMAAYNDRLRTYRKSGSHLETLNFQFFSGQDIISYRACERLYATVVNQEVEDIAARVMHRRFAWRRYRLGLNTDCARLLARVVMCLYGWRFGKTSPANWSVPRRAYLYFDAGPIFCAARCRLSCLCKS